MRMSSRSREDRYASNKLSVKSVGGESSGSGSRTLGRVVGRPFRKGYSAFFDKIAKKLLEKNLLRESKANGWGGG